MPLRFCANLNFLFCENGANALEKLRLAKAAGFRGVEIAYPFQFNKEEVSAVQKETDMDVVLLNISLGKFQRIIFHPNSFRKCFRKLFLLNF